MPLTRMGEADVQIHSFLTSFPDGDERSNSRTGSLSPSNDNLLAELRSSGYAASSG